MTGAQIMIVSVHWCVRVCVCVWGGGLDLDNGHLLTKLVFFSERPQMGLIKSMFEGSRFLRAPTVLILKSTVQYVSMLLK